MLFAQLYLYLYLIQRFLDKSYMETIPKVEREIMIYNSRCHTTLQALHAVI